MEQGEFVSEMCRLLGVTGPAEIRGDDFVDVWKSGPSIAPPVKVYVDHAITDEQRAETIGYVKEILARGHMPPPDAPPRRVPRLFDPITGRRKRPRKP